MRTQPVPSHRLAVTAGAPSTALLAGAAVIALLAGCASPPHPSLPPWPTPPAGGDGPPPGPRPDLASLPDAVPRIEPLRIGGPNKPYDVLGERYVPMTGDVAYSQRGVASWYGRKFHGRRTANGEVFDMYAMTAAHRTMPLPSYARVRNPANGRTAIVRVNDRGPFVHGRVIDLSYAAATKLGIQGVGTVEIARLTFADIAAMANAAAPQPAAPAPAVAANSAEPVAQASPVAAPELAPLALPPGDAAAETPPPMVANPPGAPQPRPLQRAETAAAAGLWLQLGAFANHDGATALRQRAGDVVAGLAPLLTIRRDGAWSRVQAGPFDSPRTATEMAQRIAAELGVVPLWHERR